MRVLILPDRFVDEAGQSLRELQLLGRAGRGLAHRHQPFEAELHAGHFEGAFHFVGDRLHVVDVAKLDVDVACDAKQHVFARRIVFRCAGDVEHLVGEGNLLGRRSGRGVFLLKDVANRRECHVDLGRGRNGDLHGGGWRVGLLCEEINRRHEDKTDNRRQPRFDPLHRKIPSK